MFDFTLAVCILTFGNMSFSGFCDLLCATLIIESPMSEAFSLPE